jgi:molybdopterin/thiamine biosynthesis adenylyltransferase
LGKEQVQKIEKATLVFVGTGTINSNLAVSLAGSGFKNFILIDGDKVSRRNIPLCDSFNLEDVGNYKVKVLKKFLRDKYGNRLNIKSYPVYVDRVPSTALSNVDMLVLGVDNNATRLFMSYYCMQKGMPMVNLGFWGWEASYMLCLPQRTACWACLFRPKKRKDVEEMKKARKCPEPEPNIPGGVIHGTVSRLIGIATNEITKYFLKKRRIVQYYAFHALTCEEDIRFLDSANYLKPDPDCPICRREEGIDVSKLKANGK